MSNNASLLEAAFQVARVGKRCLEHFDSGLRAKVNMFSKVDIGESTSTKLANETIVSQLLLCVISHLFPLTPKSLEKLFHLQTSL
jgi:hypothetical protein